MKKVLGKKPAVKKTKRTSVRIPVSMLNDINENILKASLPIKRRKPMDISRQFQIYIKNLIVLILFQKNGLTQVITCLSKTLEQNAEKSLK